MDTQQNVWIVNRFNEVDGLYVFEDEHRARDFASRYGEDATVSEEVVMNDSAAGQFLIDTAADDPDESSATDTRDRLDAAREWLGERAPGLAVLYERSYSPHMLREAIGEHYPGNTPGQDGWTSFCEDWAAGTLAPASSAARFDAATGQERR